MGLWSCYLRFEKNSHSPPKYNKTTNRHKTDSAERNGSWRACIIQILGFTELQVSCFSRLFKWDQVIDLSEREFFSLSLRAKSFSSAPKDICNLFVMYWNLSGCGRTASLKFISLPISFYLGNFVFLKDVSLREHIFIWSLWISMPNTAHNLFYYFLNKVLSGHGNWLWVYKDSYKAPQTLVSIWHFAGEYRLKLWF